MTITTSADIYLGTKIELDQFGAPEFDAEDFNYFAAKATENVLRRELEGFELTQAITDDIAPLIKSVVMPYNASSATDVRLADLPLDYRHVVSVLVRLRYKANTVSYALNATRLWHTKRITGDGNAYIFDDYYLRPQINDADMNLYHRVIGKKLKIEIDTPARPETKAYIENVTLEYISTTPAISVDDDFNTLVDTVFPEQFNRRIVSECAKLFLENAESQRLQTNAEVNR